MKFVALVTLATGAAFGLGFFAGERFGDPTRNADADPGEGLAVSMTRMARALERVETNLATDAPTLATRPSDPSLGPGNADITKMLAGITERLDRLSSAQGQGITPETSRDRTTDQAAGLRSFAEQEAQVGQKRHFMLTCRDLLRLYGVPDRVNDGSPSCWEYLLDREAPSESAAAYFSLVDGHVVLAEIERKP